MDGRPVWLASVSRIHKSGRTFYVPEWSAVQLRQAERLLRSVLAGAGDPAFERLFRMNITLCLHRAATPAEVLAAPSWFLTAAGSGLAGGPVAVLRETVRGALSTKPCEAPGRQVIDRSNPHGWIPIDCGACPPCRARERV